MQGRELGAPAPVPPEDDRFDDGVEAVRRQLRLLESRTSTPEELRKELVRALEELRISQAELRAQNDELTAAHFELEQERARYRELFDLAPESYFLTDLGAVIQECNLHAAQLLNIERRFLIGKALASFVLLEDRPRFRSALNELVSSPASYQFGIRLQPRRDQPIEVALSVSVARDQAGRPAGLRWLLRNTTDQARLMEQLVRREEEARSAAEASEARSRHVQKLESIGVLAGGLAHDFNNLLHVILGNADLALARTSPRSTAREPLDEIVRATHRAADLTRQMLAYSGKGAIEVRLLDLSREVREMATLLRSAISKQVTLVYDLASELPAVRADPTQMRQILMNLITNASDAIGDQPGTITLRTRLGKYEADEVVLEVSDTGTGMDTDTLQRIFDPFFTTKFSGRGLGLAAVMGIVKGHGGQIRIRTAPGQGTTFRIFFPAAAPAADPATLDTADLGDWRGHGTVLVAEDEEGVREIARRMLGDLGFTTLTAADGREAVGIMARHGIDVVAVLLDLSMPRMGGREAFHRIRERWPKLPIVLMSGYTEQVMIPQVSDARNGPTSYLQKPFLLEDLGVALKRLLVVSRPSREG
jgi:two-component system, cell cycle sensor histidine kinase and response regulator CckA